MYANAASIIAWKYNAVPLDDFIVNQDENGTEITYWNLPLPKPTLAQVMAFEADYLAAVSQDAPLRRVEAVLPKKPARLIAALVVRMSGSWANMTNAERNRVTTILDNAGATILTALRG